MSKATETKPDRSNHKPDTDDASAKPPKSDRNRSVKSREASARRLDEGLEETFPSSDPVSVTITK